MRTTIHLLVVEDNDGQFETYSDTADELSAKDERYQFKLTREKDSKAALEALLSKNFDAAIVDLNLTENHPAEASGNEILEKIIEIHRFPVFIVSGNLGMLNEEIKDRQSLFLRCYDRDTSNNDIFDEIKKISCTGITRILGGRGMIEDKLAEIFWKHLANDFDIWIENDNGSEKALLRYAVSHLSEYLDLPLGDDVYYSDAEYYIKPPIREIIATGDIAEKKADGSRFIVLSPACDIAIREKDDNENPIINAKRLTLAKLVKINPDSFIENEIIKDSYSSNQRRSILEKIIKGQQDKYIFLPGYKELCASIVDLQNLYTIDFDEYRESYTRIATIASPFLKDIQSRFSSYYGRQGQPDLDKTKLINQHKNDLSETA